MPTETFGQRAVAEKKTAYDVIPADDQHRLKKEKAMLVWQAEERNRDRGTGLNARGK